MTNKIKLVVLLTLVLGAYTGGWQGLVVTAVLLAVLRISIGALLDRYEARLTKRMEADTPITWNLWINNVQVGTVTDAQYAAMQRHAARDGRNAIAQLFNLGQMALVVADKLLVAVPLTCFWTAIAMAAFSPDAFLEVAQQLQDAGPAAITSAVQSFMQVGVEVFVIVVVMMVAMGLNFGFKNFYAEAVNRMLRRHCNTPVEGHVLLTPQVSGDPVADS